MSEFDDDDLAAAFDDEFDDNDGEEVSAPTGPVNDLAEHQRNSLQLQFPADHFRHSAGLSL